MSEALTNAAKALFDGNGGDPFDPAKPTMALALVREAVGRLGWSTMGYRCDGCGYEVAIWLALGVEGPPELREADLYFASPFTARCFACAGKPTERPAPPPFDKQPLNGTLMHSVKRLDSEFPPRLIPDDAPRFVLPPSAWRGDGGAHLDLSDTALVNARRWFYEGSSS